MCSQVYGFCFDRALEKIAFHAASWPAILVSNPYHNLINRSFLRAESL